MDKREPMIYAYMSYVSDRFGYIKVGYTEENPQRVIFDESQWTGLTPGIVLIDSAIRKDGSILTGETFREYLRQQGYKELSTGYDYQGWFDCSPEDIITAYKHAISQHIGFFEK